MASDMPGQFQGSPFSEIIFPRDQLEVLRLEFTGRTIKVWVELESRVEELANDFICNNKRRGMESW